MTKLRHTAERPHRFRRAESLAAHGHAGFSQDLEYGGLAELVAPGQLGWSLHRRHIRDELLDNGWLKPPTHCVDAAVTDTFDVPMLNTNEQG